jgi:glycosyltransferase involved in cell wall biosynthesis
MDTLSVEHFPAQQRSLRVALVTETYPPEVNGVALTVAQVVKGLRARNHAVQLVRPRQVPGEAADQGPRFHEVLMRGLPIPRYPHLRMGLPAQRSLVQMWAQARPDVVHIATEGPLGWSALQAAHQLKLPVTSDFRTNFHAYSQHYGIGWLRKPIMAYLRKFHNRTLATMVPTEPLRRELAAAGFQGVQVVARGVDTVLFNPQRRNRALRAQWGVQDDTLVVACVGRLAAEKNLDLLVQAFTAIQAEQPTAKLLLVGDGPLRDTLARKVPGVLMAGRRSGDDLAEHYASADLFLFPSLTETFGNVTTEALASGLPVLAFDYAAAAELITPGENGHLVPFGDHAAFVRAALTLAGQPTYRRALGEGARRLAEAQGWDAIIQRFEAVLLQAMPPLPQPAPAVLPAWQAA